MIKTYKVMLLPNNKQKTKLFECAGVARWAYNWALEQEQISYKNSGKFINDRELRKRLTELKQTEEYKWLNNYSNNITKQAIKDACTAYKNFFEGRNNFPKFKSKKRSKQSFYQDTVKIVITETQIKLEKLTTSKKKNKQKLNWIKLAEKGRIPTGKNIKYSNPRATFDGLNWWLSIGVEIQQEVNESLTEGIGIDLGIKDLAVVSTGQKFKNINKSKKVKKLEKRLKRLQRKLSKKYELNKIQIEGGEARYRKTKNIKKLESLVLKIRRRLKNIRHNYIHQITTSLVRTKPKYVVMESLNTCGMLKNRKLSKSIQEQLFYEFKKQMEYKCAWNNIKFILADRFYPSSKTCSNCGYIKDNISLSERVFVCDECGYEIDRDLNASINLKNYGKSIA
ncbi:transposase [Thermoanaerobacterium sp. PSU-2]|uniref:RNA-guided endonuclease InsQ/TnpB family protein n=1 Tax=Thermoanaerobacterium sp. PSU-2 TaxID=1930849 RepID=UPI000A153716|nr:RNA-guided endonuclease TnpB family protein [Thermoanaerobacterium sp. PSU-2]ORX24501.1 transposase [Thermoanaerobacterium sp. PSU-2]